MQPPHRHLELKQGCMGRNVRVYGGHRNSSLAGGCGGSRDKFKLQETIYGPVQEPDSGAVSARRVLRNIRLARC